MAEQTETCGHDFQLEGGRCLKCGEQVIPLESPAPPIPSTTAPPCWKCKGRGKVPSSNDCNCGSGEGCDMHSDMWMTDCPECKLKSAPAPSTPPETPIPEDLRERHTFLKTTIDGVGLSLRERKELELIERIGRAEAALAAERERTRKQYATGWEDCKQAAINVVCELGNSTATSEVVRVGQMIVERIACLSRPASTGEETRP